MPCCHGSHPTCACWFSFPLGCPPLVKGSAAVSPGPGESDRTIKLTFSMVPKVLPLCVPLLDSAGLQTKFELNGKITTL